MKGEILKIKLKKRKKGEIKKEWVDGEEDVNLVPLFEIFYDYLNEEGKNE